MVLVIYVIIHIAHTSLFHTFGYNVSIKVDTWCQCDE